MTARSGAKPVRVFVYGSCVSRDTFGYLDPARYELVNYVARQSLVSAFSLPAAPLVDPGELTSAFQRRMIEQDANSALPGLLADAAAETDLLLWDLFDERLGFFRGLDGAITTNSVEVQRVFRTGRLEDRRRCVTYGSREHLDAFKNAFARFIAVLTEMYLLDRILLLAPPWASRTETGAATPTSFGLEAAVANELTKPYLELVQDSSQIPVLTTEHSSTIASTSHVWGLAPFHYTDSVYRDMCAQIEQFTDARSACHTSSTE